MDDMHDQHETPTSDAARGVGQYLTGTLAAADLSVRLLTWFRQQTDALQPGDLEQAGAVLDPEREAYDAMLTRDSGRNADSRTALLAWVSAQPHREDDPQAELVASRAEARLRDLHPDAMTRYDQLRAGLSPVEAMREVVPLIVVEQQQATAREAFSPLLDPISAGRASSGQALGAWSAALPLAETLPDAARAAAAAEARLRELHPDAMSRYDALRASHTPAAALDEVAPLIDPTMSTTPDRAAGAGAAADPAGPQPAQAPEHRYAAVVREVLPDHLADKVLQDESWSTLASALARAERLGANPVDLLAVAAGERELDSAKHVAGVLTFRIEQRGVSPRGAARTPTAADVVIPSYPMPMKTTGHHRQPQEHDPAVLGAALELGREESAASGLVVESSEASRSAGHEPRAVGGATAETEDQATTPGEQRGARDPAVLVGSAAATTARHGYPTEMRAMSVNSTASTTALQGSEVRGAAARKPPTTGRRR